MISITNEHTLSQEDVRRYLEDESNRIHEILSVGQELSFFMKTNENDYRGAKNNFLKTYLF